MCPACIGSALVMLTGVGSTGGLALLASKIAGRKRADAGAAAGKTAAREPPTASRAMAAAQPNSSDAGKIPRRPLP